MITTTTTSRKTIIANAARKEQKRALADTRGRNSSALSLQSRFSSDSSSEDEDDDSSSIPSTPPFKSPILKERSPTSGGSSKLSLREQIKRDCLNPVPQQKGRPALPAFVFDIDGVFKNGGKYASFGASAIAKLQANNIPYVFMTNGGGGRTEALYAETMNQKLSAFDSKQRGDSEYASEDQMVLSYSPFATHLNHVKDEPVLIVGCPRAMNAARQQGFKKAMHLSEYTRRHDTMNPFSKAGCEKDDQVLGDGKERWNENFQAILVYTDPSDFFEALQVLTDVLLSSRPGEVEYERNHRIPIVFSNPDLLWKTQYANARFGQGAFRLSLEACYKARMQAMGIDEDEIKSRLEDFVQFGKPHHAQFYHARESVLRQADNLGCSVSHFYMVGDNPRSDIKGAVKMNEVSKHKGLVNWSGMLVRTGVWRDGDDTMGATDVHNNVVEVIDTVLKKHQDEIDLFKSIPSTEE
eukprot:CAMPEP_0114521370 /NCGR_PEP_ID=MMETSP0109-20121206/20148_1 /TAXON_ID=29199 /ORGANISM="Chlorarachnion reptans, Strain CCCM449" /LENGTH=466 /DNA_ID=CAMNT_0001702467 /DNA_START=180 /DNA_END=1580 /DNA_ORIENTATION=+